MEKRNLGINDEEIVKPTVTERRRLTRNSMFRLIYSSPSTVSKQQIASTLEVSLPTVHQNIAELLDADLIRPGEIQASTGGRPAVGYVANEAIRYAIGAAVTVNHIRYLAVDLKFNELSFKEIDCSFTSAEAIAGIFADELEIFIDENGLDRKKLLGVGITFQGIISPEQDRIILSPPTGLKDESLAPFREKVPYPLFIGNDSTCAGASESEEFSLDNRKESYVYLFWENGVGGAIYLNNENYIGSNNHSAEFGHMTIVPKGRVCNCGKQGCLEAYCSAFRFTRDLGINADRFFEEVQNGNEEYKKLWDEILEYMAIGIANLHMAFDCPVILGGFVTTYLDPYMDRLRELVSVRNAFEMDSSYLQIGRYARKAGMIGAAGYFISNFIMGI